MATGTATKKLSAATAMSVFRIVGSMRAWFSCRVDLGTLVSQWADLQALPMISMRKTATAALPVAIAIKKKNMVSQADLRKLWPSPASMTTLRWLPSPWRAARMPKVCVTMVKACKTGWDAILSCKTGPDSPMPQAPRSEQSCRCGSRASAHICAAQ